jgi:acyl-lipid omega-6 desaturase (Delta-12 desaturase)
MSDKSLHQLTKPYAKDNALQSWWYVLSTSFYVLAALIFTLPWLPLPFRIASSCLSGLLIVRLFVIYHDHQHRAILSKSRIAEIYMRVFGIAVLCPSTTWRESHNYHHAHNCQLFGSALGSFPVMTREQYLKSSKMERFKYLFIRNPIVIFSGYFTVFFMSMTVMPVFQNPRKHYDCALALALHLVGVVTLVISCGWLGLLLTMLLPFIIASAMGSYLFYAQHNYPNVKLRDKDGWTYEGAALESSSYLKTGKLMEWFTANIGYHHIHHLNHRIPFYRLPQVFRETPELQKATVTKLNPIEMIRCLRLKLWDVEKQRLVNLRGH